MGSLRNYTTLLRIQIVDVEDVVVPQAAVHQRSVHRLIVVILTGNGRVPGQLSAGKGGANLEVQQRGGRRAGEDIVVEELDGVVAAKAPLQFRPVREADHQAEELQPRLLLFRRLGLRRNGRLQRHLEGGEGGQAGRLRLLGGHLAALRLRLSLRRLPLQALLLLVRPERLLKGGVLLRPNEAGHLPLLAVHSRRNQRVLVVGDGQAEGGEGGGQRLPRRLHLLHRHHAVVLQADQREEGGVAGGPRSQRLPHPVALRVVDGAAPEEEAVFGGDKVGEAGRGEDLRAEAVRVAVGGRVEVEEDEANLPLALLEEGGVAGAGKGRVGAAVLLLELGDEAVHGAGCVVVCGEGEGRV